MFVIRSAQREAFRDAIRGPFRRRILAFVRETIPEKTGSAPEADLLARITRADRKAVAHGLKTERGITLFAAMTFIAGPDFDEMREIRALFDLPGIDQDLKMTWFVKSLAIDRSRLIGEARPIDRLASGIGQALGAIFAAILSPMLLGATGGTMLQAGISTGPGIEAASAAAETIGAGLLVAGEAVLAVLTSPVAIAVMAVAVVAIGAIVLYNEIKKVDEKSKELSDKEAGTETKSCPKPASSTPPNPEGGGPEEEAPPEDKPPKFKASKEQVQAKFGKHAEDFGVKGNYNKANGKAFEDALREHVESPGTRAIKGEYSRGASPQEVTHHVNPETGNNVMTDPDGNFISGWKLSPAQLRHVLTTGKLGGG